MTADRPTTEPRTAYTRAHQFYNERNLPQPYYDLLDEVVAEAAQEAITECQTHSAKSWDDGYATGKREAAQGAAPCPPCPICGKPDLFIGTDGKPGCPHCEVAVRLPSEVAAPRAEGLAIDNQHPLIRGIADLPRHADEPGQDYIKRGGALAVALDYLRSRPSDEYVGFYDNPEEEGNDR